MTTSASENNLCPVCNQPKNNKKNITCSRSCANTFFRSGENNSRHRSGEDNYRTICFLYHDRKCCVCGEEISLCCHHFDLNHYNNDPSNLIPLCLNHHFYIHHKKYFHLVEQKINDYRELFLEKFTTGNDVVHCIENYENW